MKTSLQFLLLLLVVLSAGAAGAQVTPSFRIAASGLSTGGCGSLPYSTRYLQFLEGTGAGRVYTDTDVQFIDTIDGLTVFALLYDGTIVRITPDNVRTPFSSSPRGIGASGFEVTPQRILVSYRELSGARLSVIPPAGTLEATYDFPPGVPSPSSLAANGCILYYRSGSGLTIKRFDVCAGVPLTDFATVSEEPSDIEVLPNGQLLVAVGKDILLYDATGVFVRRVGGFPAIHSSRVGQIAVTPDLQTVWFSRAGCNSSAELRSVPFAGGTETTHDYDFLINDASNLILGSHLATVPTATEWGLLALATMLALAGVAGLRLR